MTDWMKRGACRGADDPELWFPLGDGPQFHVQIEEVKAICRSCPVVLNCLAEGLTHKDGIWGGTTEKERQSLRRQLPKHTPRPPDTTPKECSRCGESKPRTAFNRHQRTSDGFAAECRDCRNATRQPEKENAA